MNVAETIRKITREHLGNGGCAIGQCLTAVGWVGGTVPEMTEEEGLIELAISDVSGGGIAVGLALAGKRPIYIVRYQGFQWFNAPIVINYAAKSKEMWGNPCPVFIRSIGMEGGMGPVASNSHHGIFTRMPGVAVCAPMTPKEYESIWKWFMEHDDPLYVSEHRRSFKIDYELPDIVHEKAYVTLFPISSTRLNALEAVELLKKEKIVCNIVNLLWLKPLGLDERILNSLKNSKYGGIVIDGDYEDGTAKSIAFNIMERADKKVRVLGLEEKTAGFAPHLDNPAPTPQRIYNFVQNITAPR